MNERANQLINEKSPYLLQHAHNPVNWYPWDEEAFEKAHQENKMIFVSIGYSTCHWCHVMAHESFENQEVADILNEYFISIKVDREERPDVDSIYMSACQALTGSGGWPLSVFINESKEPIYAGTYFPKDVFINLLEKLANLWETNRTLLYQNAKMITKYLEGEKQDYFVLTDEIIDEAYQALLYRFDENYGGFGRAPKFPTPHNLLFLLKYYQIKEEKKALKMVIKTLDSMRAGGIYDHVEYGFCRYSIDEKWLVPHFEKMLYDNVLLLQLYSEVYNITKLERFKQTALEIITFLLNEMHHQEGAFYTAIDADSEGEEGKYYLFTYEEIVSAIGLDAAQGLGVTKEGNFDDKNIINTIGCDEFIDEEIREKLLNIRKEKVKPHLDDKILTSFNGLAVAAFAVAGRYIDQKYLEIAEEIYNFIKSKLLDNGRLKASYRNGVSKITGFAEDYAYFIYGIIELYLSTYKEEYIKFALLLNQTFINHYYDYEEGGFFITANDGETILFRKKEIYDGATPSANAIAVNNLIRLSHLVGDYTLEEKAIKTINCFGKEIDEYPLGYTFSILNKLLKDEIIEIKLEGNNLKAMLEVIKAANLPFYTISIINTNRQNTAYICKNNSCLPPITSLSELSYTFSTKRA